MYSTCYRVSDAVCDGSSFAGTRASKNRYWPGNTFGRSTLLVV
jgi:hypothetical protein